MLRNRNRPQTIDEEELPQTNEEVVAAASSTIFGISPYTIVFIIAIIIVIVLVILWYTNRNKPAELKQQYSPDADNPGLTPVQQTVMDAKNVQRNPNTSPGSASVDQNGRSDTNPGAAPESVQTETKDRANSARASLNRTKPPMPPIPQLTIDNPQVLVKLGFVQQNASMSPTAVSTPSISLPSTPGGATSQQANNDPRVAAVATAAFQV